MYSGLLSPFAPGLRCAWCTRGRPPNAHACCISAQVTLGVTQPPPFTPSSSFSPFPSASPGTNPLPAVPEGAVRRCCWRPPAPTKLLLPVPLMLLTLALGLGASGVLLKLVEASAAAEEEALGRACGWGGELGEVLLSVWGVLPGAVGEWVAQGLSSWLLSWASSGTPGFGVFNIGGRRDAAFFPLRLRFTGAPSPSLASPGSFLVSPSPCCVSSRPGAGGAVLSSTASSFVAHCAHARTACCCCTRARCALAWCTSQADSGRGAPPSSRAEGLCIMPELRASASRGLRPANPASLSCSLAAAGYPFKSMGPKWAETLYPGLASLAGTVFGLPAEPAMSAG
mmetsp:Transcript_9364/g.23764  ORF Transcript_9364/g.23764 Transcript_9364/m.23764 type:complete len:341 (-) Transcript_9364:1414-2436(-)